MTYRYWGRNRNMCDVLEEMRKAVTTLNFSYLDGLIEEVQSMGNRMEAALGDMKDIEEMRREKSKLKKEIEKLEKTCNSLKPETTK